MTLEDLDGDEGLANYIRDNCGSSPEIEELLRLARRGLRAERERCGTCGMRQTHGAQPWCPLHAGRRDNEDYCEAWIAKGADDEP